MRARPGPRARHLPNGVLPGAACLAAGVLLAACGSGSPHASGTTSSTAPPSTSGTTGTSGASGTSGTTGTSGTSGTSGSSGTSGTTGTSGTSGTSGSSSPTTSSTLVPTNGNVNPCATSSLGLSLGSSSGSAGAIDVAIVFTNTGKLTCYLYGYPSVAAVTSRGGAQLGLAAERATQLGPPSFVKLRPGAKANADLHVVDAANYPKATCRPTTPGGFRVVPPNAATAGFVASSLQVCAAGVPHALAVGPVTAGAASSVNGG